MNDKITICSPRGDEDLQRYAAICGESFFMKDMPFEEWVAVTGAENMRVALLNNVVAGGLVLQPMGQWFGGQSVPMTGVTVVGVAPEHRGAGVGAALMESAVREMHRQGVALSVLYPATQPLYQRVGFEKAGVRTCYSLQASAIEVGKSSLNIRPIGESDRDAVRRLYAQRAQCTTGNLDRNEWAWLRFFEPTSWKPKTKGYLAEGTDGIEGYLFVAPQFGELALNKLDITDFVAMTPEAGRCLLRFIANHRSMVEEVRWVAAPADPLMFLFREQVWETYHRVDWMLRIVNVKTALEARGYPPHVEARVDFEIHNDLLEANNGRFQLNVSQGRGCVTAGGKGSLRVDIRGLAPIYSGHVSPLVMPTTGFVEGDDAALRTAVGVFSGPHPWMSDMI